MATRFSHIAGREVDTYSEEWRHECECAWLLDNKPTKAAKHIFLYGVPDRDTLMQWDADAGVWRLADDWKSRVPAKTMSTLSVRGLEAADRILADAKKLWAARQSKSPTRAEAHNEGEA